MVKFIFLRPFASGHPLFIYGRQQCYKGLLREHGQARLKNRLCRQRLSNLWQSVVRPGKCLPLLCQFSNGDRCTRLEMCNSHGHHTERQVLAIKSSRCQEKETDGRRKSRQHQFLYLCTVELSSCRFAQEPQDPNCLGT